MSNKSPIHAFRRRRSLRLLPGLAVLLLTFAARAAAGPVGHARSTSVGVCDSLQAPAGSQLLFHAFATGVQIYRWNGAAWSFVAPSAVLYADAQLQGSVAIHYAGPTWQSVSGSKVVGAVLKRCTPDTNAIPWLSLSALADDAPGIFQWVTFIQRVNTAGGKAPSNAGTVVGEEARVPYTAEYFFYRAP